MMSVLVPMKVKVSKRVAGPDLRIFPMTRIEHEPRRPSYYALTTERRVRSAALTSPTSGSSR